MKTAAVVFGMHLMTALPRQSASTIENARQLFASGKLKEAANIYSTLVVINPTMPDSHLGLIRARLEMNDVAGAVNAARDAVAAFPSSPQIAAAAGDVQFRIGHFPQASVLYTRATQSDPMLARGWWGLGRL